MKQVRTILIAEDIEDDVFFFRRALKQAHITSQVFTVGDGVDAIAYLRGDGAYADRAKYPMPEILFLDISMPRKSGFDVLEWLRTATGDVPLTVCMLSSSVLPKDEERAHQLGADAYAVKPPTPALFERLHNDLNLDWPR